MTFQNQLGIVRIFLFFLVLYIQCASGQRVNGIQANDGNGTKNKCPSLEENSPCSCQVMSKGLDIVCDNADFKQIQNTLDRLKKESLVIYWMKLHSCKFPRIKDYIFLGLDVRHLNIIRSNVSVIERSSLSALGETLGILDLSHNNIHRIPTMSFYQLKKLDYLNLNYNRITSINKNAFEGLAMLEGLSLYENKIKHIHDDAFKGVGRNIARLYLGKNLLDDFTTEPFHPLKNLLVLNLNENNIKHLKNGVFDGLHKLEMLKLEHNSIDIIESNVFSDLKMLNSLNLEHNKIRNISNDTFAGLENHLEWLELGNNLLDHIPSHALRQLHNLRQLDLDSNRITEISEDAFRGYGDNMNFLILDKNHLKSIPPLAFTDLHSLEWLKLSHNELSTLTEDTVQPILDTVTHIDVSNNPLVCNCEISWLYEWLLDPRNSDNLESTDDHICRTPDLKTHTMKLLSRDHFDCKRRYPPPPPTEDEMETLETTQQNSTSETSNVFENVTDVTERDQESEIDTIPKERDTQCESNDSSSVQNKTDYVLDLIEKRMEALQDSKCDVFGTYVAKSLESLRKTSPPMYPLVKKLINDAIFEGEMGTLSPYSRIVQHQAPSLPSPPVDTPSPNVEYNHSLDFW